MFNGEFLEVPFHHCPMEKEMLNSEDVILVAMQVLGRSKKNVSYLERQLSTLRHAEQSNAQLAVLSRSCHYLSVIDHAHLVPLAPIALEMFTSLNMSEEEPIKAIIERLTTIIGYNSHVDGEATPDDYAAFDLGDMMLVYVTTIVQHPERINPSLTQKMYDQILQETQQLIQEQKATIDRCSKVLHRHNSHEKS